MAVAAQETLNKTSATGEHASGFVLQARNMRKSFGGIQAVDDVSFELGRGEILGMVGDNGAGKSTLIKIVSGAYKKDSGEVLLDGQPVEIEGTAHARALGMETVYQSSGLVEVMDAPANLFLGREKLKDGWLGKYLGMIDKRFMREETRQLLQRLNITVRNLAAPVQTLSGGQQQSVAVGRAAYWKGRIIILDEPANNIGVDQQRAVLELVRQIRDEHGISFIMISHNMEHIFQVADRVIVMRNGKKVGDKRVEETTRNEVVGLITGALA